MAEGNYICNAKPCEHYRSLKSYTYPGEFKPKYKLEEVDMQHVYEAHLRTWALYQESRAENAEREVKEIKAELAAIRARTTQTAKPVATTAVATATTAPATIEAPVDPRNHVDGICDALVINGPGIYKCTDPCRHGRRVCPLHLNNKYLVEAVANAETKTDSKTEATTDSKVEAKPAGKSKKTAAEVVKS